MAKFDIQFIGQVVRTKCYRCRSLLDLAEAMERTLIGTGWLPADLEKLIVPDPSVVIVMAQCPRCGPVPFPFAKIPKVNRETRR